MVSLCCHLILKSDRHCHVLQGWFAEWGRGTTWCGWCSLNKDWYSIIGCAGSMIFGDETAQHTSKGKQVLCWNQYRIEWQLQRTEHQLYRHEKYGYWSYSIRQTSLHKCICLQAWSIYWDTLDTTQAFPSNGTGGRPSLFSILQNLVFNGSLIFLCSGLKLSVIRKPSS